jgi:hypothetical protein
MKSIPNETELHLLYLQETGEQRPDVEKAIELEIGLDLSDEEVDDITQYVDPFPVIPKEITNYVEWLETKIKF